VADGANEIFFLITPLPLAPSATTDTHQRTLPPNAEVPCQPFLMFYGQTEDYSIDARRAGKVPAAWFALRCVAS